MTAQVLLSTAKTLPNRWCASITFVVVLAVGQFAFGPSYADVDDEGDVPATTELNEKTNDREQRRKGVIQERQRRLMDERQLLKFQKRTKHPFKVERLLRRDIRRNEQRQNWNKGEIRRLEHRNRRIRSGAK